MTHPSIVAVYGIPVVEQAEDEEGPLRREADVPPVDRGPVRLGTGTLEHERVVILDDELSRQVSSRRPPQLLRVGIA